MKDMDIPGMTLKEIDLHEDDRGWFGEMWKIGKAGSSVETEFAPKQFNVSMNKSIGTVRGMHAEPWNKYVAVLSGSALGCWVDTRRGSSFGHTQTRKLEPGIAVFVPRGVANGFQTLEKNTIYAYLVDGLWDPNAKYMSFNPFDQFLNLDWAFAQSDSIISEKDRNSTSFIFATSNTSQ